MPNLKFYFFLKFEATTILTQGVCQTQALTVDTHERGLDIAERLGFSLYDSMIVSSALQCGCSVLYSEAMQHGQEIDGQLVVLNPFLGN